MDPSTEEPVLNTEEPQTPTEIPQATTVKRERTEAQKEALKKYLNKRLEEHNSGTGADATRGEQWKYFAIFGGFPNRRTALRFESLLHLHRVQHVTEWVPIARALVTKYVAEFGDVVQQM